MVKPAKTTSAEGAITEKNFVIIEVYLSIGTLQPLSFIFNDFTHARL